MQVQTPGNQGLQGGTGIPSRAKRTGYAGKILASPEGEAGSGWHLSIEFLT